jgi:two-component sensor histidine kinase/copper chaperone CopZ
MNLYKIALPVSGKICTNCAAEIEKDVRLLFGVQEAHIDYVNEKLLVTFDSSQITELDIVVRMNRICNPNGGSSDEQQHSKRLKILVEVLQYSASSIAEYLDFALGPIIEITNSKIGYIYHYNEDQQVFTLNSWSKDVMQECSIVEKQTVYTLDKTGLWGEAVRQRKPILVNDFQMDNPHKKGYPKGHVELRNFLTVPIFIGDRIVAVVAVANKCGDYGDADIWQLTLLMDVVWKVVERMRAEEKLIQSLNVKDTLLRELFHRTKNTMEVVRGLLVLSAAERPENTDLQQVVSDTEQRIQSIEIVHSLLYKSNDLSRISMPEYIQELCALTLRNYWTHQEQISFDLKIEEQRFLLDTAIPFGMVLNELITNSIKYAFPDNRIGLISISLCTSGTGKSILNYSDNGVGAPAIDNFRDQHSLGISLIYRIGEKQLQGKVRMESHNGIQCSIEFANQLYQERV